MCVMNAAFGLDSLDIGIWWYLNPAVVFIRQFRAEVVEVLFDELGNVA